MAGRILVIRGGALGDFILTLPAIRLLREKFPDSPLEVLGHLHIATLAEGRYYASSIRSIEYAAASPPFSIRTRLSTRNSAVISPAFIRLSATSTITTKFSRAASAWREHRT